MTMVIYNCLHCQRRMLTKGVCRKCCEKMKERDKETETETETELEESKVFDEEDYASYVQALGGANVDFEFFNDTLEKARIVFLDFARRAQETIYFVAGEFPKEVYDEAFRELESRQRKLPNLKVRVLVWSKPPPGKSRIVERGLAGNFTIMYADGRKESDRPYYVVVDEKGFRLEKDPHSEDLSERMLAMANQNHPETGKVLHQYFLLQWEEIESEIIKLAEER